MKRTDRQIKKPSTEIMISFFENDDMKDDAVSAMLKFVYFYAL